uniref:Putative HspC2 heat shock protein n=1 Tax=uncultured bacterium contig00091 TaxID=1181562 RepID=A0A806KI86_9BACT|nr:putative HspC2 heat shock protein [uncultured bacterium contig00091]
MKTLTMYRPHTIQNALSDFDRYFESFFGDSMRQNYLPSVDIQETEKAYVLEMDLPGYDEKNIEVNVDGSSLTIASKQEEMKDANEKDAKAQGTYILRERRLTSFNRSFKLPENADSASVSASFKNGILTLEINKRAEAQKRTIQINAA